MYFHSSRVYFQTPGAQQRGGAEVALHGDPDGAVRAAALRSLSFSARLGDEEVMAKVGPGAGLEILWDGFTRVSANYGDILD